MDIPRVRTVLALALLVVPLLLAGQAQAVEPQPTGTRLPAGLYGYGAATVGANGYLLGGAHEGNQFTADILQLTPSGGASKVAELPAPRGEPGVASIGGTVYIFGGTTSTPNGFPTSTSSIYTFQPGNGDAQELLGTSLPVSVTQTSAVRLGAYIYLFGGFSITGDQENPGFDWRDTIWRFNPENGDIQTMDVRLPTGRSQVTAVVHEERVLLLGGLAENDASGQLCGDPDRAVCVTDDILSFRPQGLSGTLEKLGELPQPTRWSTAALVDGVVYLLGGCATNCGPHHGQDTILTLDPVTGEVTELPVRMPAKGGRRAAVVFGQQALLPGGVRSDPAYPQEAENPSRADDRVHRIQLGATRPWAPASLQAHPADGGGIELTWQPPAYDGGAPVMSYEVHRATGGGEPQRLTEVAAPATSFVDKQAK
ncbi:MAG: hypothetical protein R3185_04125, partial [Candidatus Thermoplasmatota archaeon]|nr:hypothetical protein [Candidatus Thermoplasmatota archaeon]